MPRFPTTSRGGLIKEIDKPLGYDYSRNLADQNRLVMELGSQAVDDEKKLEMWLQSIDCLETLLAGWWTANTLPAEQYRLTIEKIRVLPTNTVNQRRKLGHYKLRALMILQRTAGFQGEKGGKGYFSKSLYLKAQQGEDDESDSGTA